MKKMIATSVFTLILLGGGSASAENKSYFDNELRMVVCKQPIPEFTLNYDSNPTEEQVSNLCKCIWSNFPAGGWERDVSRKLRQGKDAGWRTRAFFPRFGSKFKKCGGYSL